MTIETSNVITGQQHSRAPLTILLVAANLCLFACNSGRTGSQEDAQGDVPGIGSRIEGVAVEYVKDGDSFDAIYQGRDIEVRLFGIDAPEKNQPYAGSSRKAARKLLDGETVVLVIRDQDRYGRLVAMVYVPQSKVSVNQLLIEQGAAWVYTRYTRDPELLAAQESARKQRRGLWSLPVPDQIEPWTWRENNKK